MTLTNIIDDKLMFLHKNTYIYNTGGILWHIKTYIGGSQGLINEHRVLYF